MKVKKIFQTEDDITIKSAGLLSKIQAEACLLKEDRAYNTNWSLSTPGCCSHYISFVDRYGDVCIDGYYTIDKYAIRPSLNIDIRSTSFKIGDVFLFGGEEFKILAPNVAWMHKADIGKFAFSNDWQARDTNIYEASDVKKIIDEWFNAHNDKFKNSQYLDAVDVVCMGCAYGEDDCDNCPVYLTVSGQYEVEEL